MDVLITKPGDIQTAWLVGTPRAESGFRNSGDLGIGEKVANSALLQGDHVPGSDSKKLEIPAGYREEAVTKRKKEKLTQGATSKQS
jgi:hypothetical protein